MLRTPRHLPATRTARSGPTARLTGRCPESRRGYFYATSPLTPAVRPPRLRTPTAARPRRPCPPARPAHRRTPPAGHTGCAGRLSASRPPDCPAAGWWLVSVLQSPLQLVALLRQAAMLRKVRRLVEVAPLEALAEASQGGVDLRQGVR